MSASRHRCSHHLRDKTCPQPDAVTEAFPTVSSYPLKPESQRAEVTASASVPRIVARRGSLTPPCPLTAGFPFNPGVRRPAYAIPGRPSVIASAGSETRAEHDPCAEHVRHSATPECGPSARDTHRLQFRSRQSSSRRAGRVQHRSFCRRRPASDSSRRRTSSDADYG